MTESLTFGSWRVAESPVAVEYSVTVLDEIRQAVLDGFQKLSRGGVEVGGVLYGVRQGRTVRILAQRPIECEHARGPAFLLTPADESKLSAQLDLARTDPSLTGMQCMGWFVSHTRTGIALTDNDQQLYRKFFGSPWQIALVLRPGRHGGVRGGFFVWEADGTVVADRSYEEFNLPMLTPPAAAPAAGLGSFGSATAADEVPPVPPVPAERRMEMARAQRFEPPRIALDEVHPPSRLPWLLLIATLATAGVASWQWIDHTPSAPISLHVFEKEGQLEVEWNRESPAIRSAAKGELLIVDGPVRRVLPLTSSDLSKGKVTYARKSDDVEVRLKIENPKQKPLEEASRFLGTPVVSAPPAETEQLRTERDAAVAEAKRLRADQERQSARVKQLEEAIRILENRLQLTGR
jgi:hypothetical protein